MIGTVDCSLMNQGFQPGDKVLVDTHSNLGVVQDTIRALFVQRDTLGGKEFAAVLTNHSWAPLSWLKLINRGDSDND